MHVIFQVLKYYEFDMRGLNAPSSLHVSSYICFFPKSLPAKTFAIKSGGKNLNNPSAFHTVCLCCSSLHRKRKRRRFITTFGDDDMVTADFYSHPFPLRTLPCKQLEYTCQNMEDTWYLENMKRRGTLKHILSQIEAVSQGRTQRSKK